MYRPARFLTHEMLSSPSQTSSPCADADADHGSDAKWQHWPGLCIIDSDKACLILTHARRMATDWLERTRQQERAGSSFPGRNCHSELGSRAP